jgi:hypothetical protein
MYVSSCPTTAISLTPDSAILHRYRLELCIVCRVLLSNLLDTCGNRDLTPSSRTAYFDAEGTCIIGMQAKAMMPLIIFDAVVNVSYSTHSRSAHPLMKSSFTSRCSSFSRFEVSIPTRIAPTPCSAP